MAGDINPDGPVPRWVYARDRREDREDRVRARQEQEEALGRVESRLQRGIDDVRGEVVGLRGELSPVVAALRDGDVSDQGKRSVRKQIASGGLLLVGLLLTVLSIISTVLVIVGAS